MIDIRGGALSFVFANEDKYLLGNLVEMDLYPYLCYDLRAQGIEYIYMLRAGNDGYYLMMQDEASERLLNTTKLPRFFGKYGRIYDRRRRERIDWDCQDLNDLLDSKLPTLLTQESNVAVIFDLATFCHAMRDDKDETLDTFIGLQNAAALHSNAIVLVGGVSDSMLREQLAGKDSIFRHKDRNGQPLCRELADILEHPSNLPLYGEMKRRLGDRCVWLNEFSPDRVERLLRRMELESAPETFGEDQELRQLARLISGWYSSPRIRRKFGQLLRENKRHKFTDLRSDLRKTGTMFGLKKKLQEMMGEERTAGNSKGYIGVVAEDSIAEALQDIRFTDAMRRTGEAEVLQERIDGICAAYQSPRVREIPENVRTELEKTVFAVTGAIENGDMNTVKYALDALEYAQKKNFQMDGDIGRIWRCKTALVTVSGNLSRLSQRKAEDLLQIDEYRARKRSLYAQQEQIIEKDPDVEGFLERMAADMEVDLYSYTGQNALEYCRLADKSNKLDEQLKAAIARHTYHMKAYDDEEEKRDHLEQASRSINTIRMTDEEDIMREISNAVASDFQEVQKSAAKEMYDIHSMIGELSESAMSSGGVNYVSALRKFRQMRNEEDLEKTRGEEVQRA